MQRRHLPLYLMSLLPSKAERAYVSAYFECLIPAVDKPEQVQRDKILNRPPHIIFVQFAAA